jgi:hypothetical protein
MIRVGPASFRLKPATLYYAQTDFFWGLFQQVLVATQILYDDKHSNNLSIDNLVLYCHPQYVYISISGPKPKLGVDRFALAYRKVDRPDWIKYDRSVSEFRTQI